VNLSQALRSSEHRVTFDADDSRVRPGPATAIAPPITTTTKAMAVNVPNLVPKNFIPLNLQPEFAGVGKGSPHGKELDSTQNRLAHSYREEFATPLRSPPVSWAVSMTSGKVSISHLPNNYSRVLSSARAHSGS